MEDIANTPPNTVKQDAPPQATESVAMDASLILASIRSEIDAMEQARMLQSEQPINNDNFIA